MNKFILWFLGLVGLINMTAGGALMADATNIMQQIYGAVLAGSGTTTAAVAFGMLEVIKRMPPRE